MDATPGRTRQTAPEREERSPVFPRDEVRLRNVIRNVNMNEFSAFLSIILFFKFQKECTDELNVKEERLEDAGTSDAVVEVKISDDSMF